MFPFLWNINEKHQATAVFICSKTKWSTATTRNSIEGRIPELSLPDNFRALDILIGPDNLLIAITLAFHPNLHHSFAKLIFTHGSLIVVIYSISKQDLASAIVIAPTLAVSLLDHHPSGLHPGSKYLGRAGLSGASAV